MNHISRRIEVILISAILLMTVASALSMLPVTGAHDPAWQVPTYMYIASNNNPIGVNQPLLVVFWTNAIPPTRQGAYGDAWQFNVGVTKPDGTKETLGPFTSDPIGGTYTIYTPTQVGPYIFVANFIQHTVTGQPMDPRLPVTQQYAYATWGDVYLASQSQPLTVTVQQQAITPWTETPLPTSYWTRPVNDINRNWYVLLGNWLSGAAQTYPAGAAGGCTTSFCFGLAPESAHVMWATPMWTGGIMDERFGNTGFETGHYEGLQFSPPIILDGKIFYNINTYPKEGWVCLSLYTGQQLYFRNTTGPVTGIGGGFDSAGAITGDSLAFGQVYNYYSPNQEGGYPYLWSTTYFNATTNQIQPNTWSMFDPATGGYICSITNVTQTEVRGASRITTGATGTSTYGKDGSILRYNIVNLGSVTSPQRFLQIWNTSMVIIYPTYGNSTQVVSATNAYWMWRPTLNFTFDGRYGFTLNASIPDVQGSILTIRDGQYVIGGISGKNNGTYVQQGNLWALNLDPTKGALGMLLWNITFTPPPSQADVVAGSGFFGAGTALIAVDPEDGVFIFQNRISLQWWGYSLATGQQLWGPTTPEGDYNYYGMYSNIYQGKLFSTGYSGVVVCYNITTGKVLWNYTAPQMSFENPYGNYPMYITAIANGKIYTVSGEHSPTQPLWRGSCIRCIDTNTGKELWKIEHWGAGIGGAHLTGSCVYAADGYIVGLNLYDNQIYAYGKGPSATTIDVKDNAVTLGSSVLITGTVTDQSPGAKARVAKGMFPVVPAVSDVSQEAMMEYVYEQQAKPTSATGVPVSLDILDPNGNTYHIGDVTSDASGGFKMLWTPQITGEYTITATFAGSKAYYSSTANTYVGVVKATASPAAVVTPAPTQPAVITPVPTQQTTAPTLAPTPSPVVIPPTSATPITTYVAIGAAVIIIIAVAAALALRRKK
jgi:outer membrane protein assembly factor BamB